MSNEEKKIESLLNKIRNNSPVPTMSATKNKPPEGLTKNRPGQLDLSMGHHNKRPQNLPFQPRKNDNTETDNKLKEIMKNSGILTIENTKYPTDIKEMESIEVLGNGTCGHVYKMKHKPSARTIAVKQMRRSGNSEETKRIVMDIEVVLKSHDCKYIVQCLGCFITDAEVWICMELMATCFDKLLKRLQKPIPEDVLGKVTVATVEALSYLKDKHGVIHRDVKPSNILIDSRGNVKLCDFGISGRLVDSLAKTRNAGCAAYMAPERIEPDPKNPDYDVRADVWSLGITLVELATAEFPYTNCKTDFEMLTKVLNQDPPCLPKDKEFSEEFRDFVSRCLKKEKQDRPKYNELKNHAFIKQYETANVDVGRWFLEAHQPVVQVETVPNKLTTRQLMNTTSSIRRFFSSQPKQPIETGAANAPASGVFSNGNRTNSHFLKLLEETQNKFTSTTSSELKSSSHPSRFSTFQTNQRTIQQQSASHPDQSDNLSKMSTSQTAKLVQSFNQSLANNQSSNSRTHYPLPLPHHTRTALVSDNNERQFRCSPIFPRRVLYDESTTGPQRAAFRSPSVSPLPLRNDFHTSTEEQQRYNCGNTSPIILQRFYHQQKQQKIAKEAEESGKKRFAAYIKFPLGAEKSGRSSRHQSPEPPPRLNRAVSSEGQSPLTLRRNFLEANPTINCSPSLSRRYISPAPPAPPPRRLSESYSVPGSPQHVRARFNYTPEPQRRLFQNNSDVS